MRDLFVEADSVAKPGIEFVALGAFQSIFDHRAASAKTVSSSPVRLKLVQFVATADRRLAKDYLRHRPAAAGARCHRRTGLGIVIDRNFRKRETPFAQQRLGAQSN